ncbi:hypothetical protein ACWEQG_26930 [Microbispora sp. NPDC004025]
MSAPQSPPRWAIFLSASAPGVLDPLGPPVTGAAPPWAPPAEAVTAACAMGVPLPARRGAHAR